MKKKDKKQRKDKVKKEDSHQHKGLTSGYLHADDNLICNPLKSSLSISDIAIQGCKDDLICFGLSERASLLEGSVAGAFKEIPSTAQLVTTPSNSLIFPKLKEMVSATDGIIRFAEEMNTITKPLTQAIDNSASLFYSLANEMIYPSKEVIEGAVVNLSALKWEVKENIDFNLNIQSFTRILDTDDYVLAGNATETHLHKDIGVSAHADFALRLYGIEEKLEHQNHLLEENNELRRENNQLTEALLDLTAFMKEHRTDKAKIKEIKYNHRFTEIIIDNKTIKLRGNTNQSLLCQILLKEEGSLSRRWEMMDLVETMGEKDFQDKDWNRTIYDAVRNINSKISYETGIKDFFILTMKTVEINPKYLNFE